MSVRIRRAERVDLEGALALREALHREHEAMDVRYRHSLESPLLWVNDFREWVRDSDHCYLVAEADGMLVGLLVAHLMVPTPVYAPDLFAHIDELYVIPSFRGQGVGYRLVEGARQWAAKEGASSLRIGVLAMNDASRAFWHRQGAAAFSITMSISAMPATQEKAPALRDRG